MNFEGENERMVSTGLEVFYSKILFQRDYSMGSLHIVPQYLFIVLFPMTTI